VECSDRERDRWLTCGFRSMRCKGIQARGGDGPPRRGLLSFDGCPSRCPRAARFHREDRLPRAPRSTVRGEVTSPDRIRLPDGRHDAAPTQADGATREAWPILRASAGDHLSAPRAGGVLAGR
jgi:hypothetical protein